jgi:hypothetical protein
MHVVLLPRRRTEAPGGLNQGAKERVSGLTFRKPLSHRGQLSEIRLCLVADIAGAARRCVVQIIEIAAADKAG